MERTVPPQGGFSNEVVAPKITFHNDSLEDLVVVTYSVNDTLQVNGIHKHDIKSSSHHSFDASTDGVYFLHIFRHGLFGLISLRTRLSSGYGFLVHTGSSYRLNIIERDEQGNWVSLHRESSEENRQITSTLYQFGDMILRPTASVLNQAALVLLSGLDSNIYRDWRSKRTRMLTETDAASLEFPLPPPTQTPVHVEERELWGVFFEQVYMAGVWALEESSITPDDVDSQEAFLFIGLPALSLGNVVFRSVDIGGDILLLVDGRCMDGSTCPSSFIQMFSMLIKTKQSLVELSPVTPSEAVWVRKFLLAAGADILIEGNFIYRGSDMSSKSDFI